MIYKIINEFTVSTKIGSYRLNISNERGPHARRIKLVGGGVANNQNMMYQLQDQINNSFAQYLNLYSDNDISRIRRDANTYALQMRAQGY